MDVLERDNDKTQMTQFKQYTYANIVSYGNQVSMKFPGYISLFSYVHFVNNTAYHSW